MGLFQCCINTGEKGNPTLIGLLVNIILSATSLCARNGDQVVKVKVAERVEHFKLFLQVLEKVCSHLVPGSCRHLRGSGFGISGKYFSQKNVHSAGSVCQPVLELQDVQLCCRWVLFPPEL